MKHYTLLLMTFVLFSKINAKEQLSSSLEKSNINLVNDAELQSKAKKMKSQSLIHIKTDQTQFLSTALKLVSIKLTLLVSFSIGNYPKKKSTLL